MGREAPPANSFSSVVSRGVCSGLVMFSRERYGAGGNSRQSFQFGASKLRLVPYGSAWCGVRVEKSSRAILLPFSRELCPYALFPQLIYCVGRRLFSANLSSCGPAHRSSV